MAQAELRKLRHDPSTSSPGPPQPLLWLFIFGTALAHNHALVPAGVEYRAYLAPGVMAQGALFVAIFFGLAVIWERDVGQLQRLLATPLPAQRDRPRQVDGRGASARSSRRTVLLIVVAIAGIGLQWTVARRRSARSSCSRSGPPASPACRCCSPAVLQTRERFMGIGQLITMPLFFASSALYPLAIMPRWLRVVARVNPLTYEVAGHAAAAARRPAGGTLWLDFLVVIAFLAVFAALATRAYPRAVL